MIAPHQFSVQIENEINVYQKPIYLSTSTMSLGWETIFSELRGVISPPDAIVNVSSIENRYTSIGSLDPRTLT